MTDERDAKIAELEARLAKLEERFPEPRRAGMVTAPTVQAVHPCDRLSMPQEALQEMAKLNTGNAMADAAALSRTLTQGGILPRSGEDKVKVSVG